VVLEWRRRAATPAEARHFPRKHCQSGAGGVDLDAEGSPQALTSRTFAPDVGTGREALQRRTADLARTCYRMGACVDQHCQAENIPYHAGALNRRKQLTMTLRADLAGKTAFVTGASSGLGRHFAHVLARSGAKVALAARRIETLREVADEIGSEGGYALPVVMDVLDSRSVRESLAFTRAELGPIDILVNNSGVTLTAGVLEQTEEQWDMVVDTNLKGAFLVATEVARDMQAGGRGGSLINIASILGFRQAGHVASYAVSKAGLVQLTKVMALELARFGIRVNALAPGYMETDLNREYWETPAGAAMLKRIPQRRLGQPEDLDGALLLLASDASRYMTGSVIAIDGGHLVSTL
jgi:NAD(P)-dependent dehydrogenase (short-subunit alcohol dehydrogenase family)